ncbi:MAG: hypothetical protein OEU92_26865 [Alphaproteobacteria bacterium]|nr:hypothetical protein [Alphaproteobacteria bacterium]
MPEPGMGANNDHGGGGLGSDRPDDNDRGGAREDKESFDQAMSDAGDKSGSSQAGMTGSERTQDAEAKSDQSFGDSLAEAKAESAKSPNDDGGGTAPSSTTPSDTPTTPEEKDDDERNVFDRAGDLFGGLGRDMQDFARENPRVDSYGNTVGLVDANSIQRGEVASGVRSSGTSSEDLATQLGFSSPQDMVAAQNTDFMEDKYQAELDKRAIEQSLNDRHGHPAGIPGLDFNPYAMGFAPEAEALIDEAYFDDIVFD